MCIEIHQKTIFPFSQSLLNNLPGWCYKVKFSRSKFYFFLSICPYLYYQSNYSHCDKLFHLWISLNQRIYFYLTSLNKFIEANNFKFPFQIGVNYIECHTESWINNWRMKQWICIEYIFILANKYSQNNAKYTCNSTGRVPEQMINNFLIGYIMNSNIYLFLFLLCHSVDDLYSVKYVNIVQLMLKIIILSLVLCCFISIEVRILNNDAFPTADHLQEINSVKLVINSNGKYIYPYHQNTFTLPQLPIGRNFVEVVSPSHVYPTLVIDSKSTGEHTFQLLHPFTRYVTQRIGEPIFLKPIDKLQFLYEQPGFSIASFLFSGTGMFVIFGVFMYLCYSKLMPNLEEAQLAPESGLRRQ